MSKKVILSGYYGFDNFGDDAILSVLCNKLKSLDAEITVISANPQKTSEEFGIQAVKNFNIKDLIKAIGNSDVLISGGGSLLQDITSLKSLLYYSFVIFTALLLKKQVIIFAQGIGPLKRNISRLIVKNLLKHAMFISVRDKKSLELLTEWNINAKLVNDPVFEVSIHNIPKNFAVGIQLRSFATLNQDFLNSLADFLLKYFPNRKFELFVFQQKLDDEICKQFINILQSKKSNVETEIIYYKNRTDIFKRIAQLDFMIAMRFHAIIAAIKAGVKTAAINYDIKVEKLANEADLPIISLDNSSNNYQEIFQKLKSLNPKELSDFSNSKAFDWTDIEKLFIK